MVKHRSLQSHQAFKLIEQASNVESSPTPTQSLQYLSHICSVISLEFIRSLHVFRIRIQLHITATVEALAYYFKAVTFTNKIAYERFYPRYAMLCMHSAIYAAARCPPVCPSVCHMSVMFSYAMNTSTTSDSDDALETVGTSSAGCGVEII